MKSIFLPTLFMTMIFLLAGNSKSYSQRPAIEWLKGMGAERYDYGFAITTDERGNVYTAGIFQPDTMVLQINNQPRKLGAVLSDDAFITKQDANGNFLWAVNFGGTGSDYANAIAVDHEGSVYVTGYFTETADFNPASPGTHVFTSPKSGKRFTSDFYVCKYDSAGIFQWVRVMGNSGDDQGTGLSFDKVTQTLVVTGDFYGTVDLGFGNSPSVPLTSAGENDAFVLKLDPAGNTVWAGQLGGADYEWGTGVATDAKGDIYLTGNYTGPGDYNPDPNADFQLSFSGVWDFYVCKLDAAGNFIWAKGIGGRSEDLSRGIALDTAGNVHVAGIYRDTVNFNPNGTYKLAANGDGFGNGGDIFILKLTSDGDFAWAGSVGSADADDDANGISVDKSGNVFVTGYFQGQRADFDPGPAAADTFYYDTYKGNADSYILKLSRDGKFNWAMHMGSGSVGYAVTNRDEYVYATGMFVDSADFDPAEVPGAHKLYAKAMLDVYVLKLIDCMAVTDTAISGPVLVCNGKEVSYHINPIPGAASYTWEFPSGWTGNEVQNEISIRPAGSGTLTVKTDGLCGLMESSLDVSISDPNPVIEVNGHILRVTEAFVSYQWYKNGAKADNETSRTYTINENGFYQVEVTDDMGCTDTSKTYEVNNVHVADAGGDHARAIVYPVPAEEIVYILGDAPLYIEVTGIDGKILRSSAVPVHSIYIGDLPDGLYFIRLKDSQGHKVSDTRIIKK